MTTRMHYLTLFKSASSGTAGVSRTQTVIARELAGWVLFREYRDSSIDIDALAVRTGFPREEISSFLWDCSGERFFTIRKRLRIADAMEMLTDDPGLVLSSVARATGFQDKSDFRRAFKDETGYSPRFWRENGGNRLRCRAAKILEACRSRCHARCTTS